MHKHAKQMMEYAQDAMETDRPWERWEMRYKESAWHQCQQYLCFDTSMDYRRKPRTILVNGYEVPEPVREAPKIGHGYYFASVNMRDFFGHLLWGEDNIDRFNLERGLVHHSREAAQAHGRAMCGIDPIKTEAV